MLLSLAGPGRETAALDWIRLARAGATVAALLSAGCISKPKPSEEGAAQKPPERVCPVAGRVDHDLTLTKACSPYLQPGGGIDIINGATLTLEAGVELRFFGQDWLEVGAGGEPGRMIAKGTPDEPIVFTFGDAETKWRGVWFHSGTLEGSVLSHAVVRRAGGDNQHSQPHLLMGCLTLTGVKPGALSIDAVSVENCVNGGLRMSNSRVRLGALSIVDSAQGFVLDPASLGEVTQGAQYRGVDHNVLLGGVVSSDARWVPQAVPYLVDGDLSVEGPSAPSLTLVAGLDLRFAKSHGLRVGETQPGALRVEGTAQAPVKLSAQQADEPWDGVRLLDQARAGTRLSHVEVTGSAGEGAVRVSPKAGQIEIANSRFSGNATDVLVGCRARLVSEKNQYASQRGLVRESCSAAKKR